MATGRAARGPVRAGPGLKIRPAGLTARNGPKDFSFAIHHCVRACRQMFPVSSPVLVIS